MGTFLAKAKSYARDYQNRRLFKCVYEEFGDSTGGVPADEIRSSIAKKAGVDEDQVFVDTPSVVLVWAGSDGAKNSQVLAISEIPLVSALSKSLNITRIYATHEARDKVEIIAGSALGRENSV